MSLLNSEITIGRVRLLLLRSSHCCLILYSPTGLLHHVVAINRINKQHSLRLGNRASSLINVSSNTLSVHRKALTKASFLIIFNLTT